ncbi:MAG: Gfo/Idh/MocA family protein [Thermoguttaceae bacterium]
MHRLSRREFWDRSKRAGLGLAAGLTILKDPQSVRAAPAHDRIILAAIGAGGRGSSLAGGFVQRGDCQYAYVCDADIRRAEALASNLARDQKPPKAVQDFRKALEDPSVVAVVIATPDHWHAPATVWACQAGKDVYVEKPPTHNCWEGQKMVQAARKYQRIVQVGTQNRSAACNRQAREYLQSGKLGKVHFCRICNQKLWGNFPQQPDAEPPKGLDWDLWNGPAPEARYNPTLHAGWHHLWRYSGGDIANDASHQIDLARWLLGVDYPKSVYSTGGRFNTTGAAETPDTQIAAYDFDGLLVVFELTLYTPYMLKISPQIRESLTEFPYWPQCATRIEIYGSQGLMIVGRHGGGWQVFDRPKSEKPVIKAQANGTFPDPEHKEDFVRAIRSRQLPSADIQEGHRSALWIHYANISYRLGGQKLLIDPETEQIVGNPEAMRLFKREYRKPYVIAEEV